MASRNSRKHGERSAEAITERRQNAALLRVLKNMGCESVEIPTGSGISALKAMMWERKDLKKLSI